MEVPSANPRSELAKSPGRKSGDRGREGALSLGYFYLGKQREVTRSQDASGKTQGRESVFAAKPINQTNPANAETNTIPTQPSP
jgi:hypothetical protein